MGRRCSPAEGGSLAPTRPTTALERLAAVPSGPYCLNCRVDFVYFFNGGDFVVERVPILVEI
jgi:hypothetical protein